MIGLVCSLIGAFGAWRVARAIRRRAALLRNPSRMKAEVIRLRCVSMGEGDTPDWHAPTVRFTAEDREVEAELDPTNDVKTFAIGRMVPIAYQQGDPSNVVAAGRMASGRAARWVALGLMLLLLAFGIALLSGKYGFRLVPSQ